jgi:hypothetical protein
MSDAVQQFLEIVKGAYECKAPQVRRLYCAYCGQFAAMRYDGQSNRFMFWKCCHCDARNEFDK